MPNIKKFFPNWIKSPLRRISDQLRREGAYHEQAGRHDIISRAMITLDFNDIQGDYVEFGCCGGYTFGCAAQALRRSSRTPRKQWAFDSFAGLPPAEISDDDHPRWIAGTMKTGVQEFHAICARKKIRNYDIVPGFYKDTLADRPLTFFPPGSIAFAYIDCDMYSSTVDVLEFLKPRLKHGMIIAFDDYWCHSESGMSGERRAFVERFLPLADWHFEPYQPYGWAGMSFVVEKKQNP